MKFRGSVRFRGCFMAAKSAGQRSSRGTSALFTVGSSIHYTHFPVFCFLYCFVVSACSGGSLSLPFSLGLLKWTLF